MSEQQTEQQTENTEEAARKWPVTVTLKYPVTFGSESITSLEFRRGRMGDLRGLKIDGLPSVDHLLLLASRLSGQPVKVIELLDAEDGARALEVALDFFARCLEDGRTR